MSCSEDLVRDQLNRILNSKQFRSSELQRKFLSFVVLKTLEGRAADLKEYSIGAEAFGRGEDFDPAIDSVVRVVARRVRERLPEFYSTSGQDDPVVIKLVPGSYVPSFSYRAQENEQLAEASNPDLPVEPPPPRPHRHWRWMAPACAAAAALVVLIYSLLSAQRAPEITKYTQLTRDGQGKVSPLPSGGHGEMVTDGSRIYFSEISGTKVVLSQVSSTGGETVALSTGADRPLVIKDIAPDGSELLVTDFYRTRPDLALEVLPLPGSVPRQLGDLVGHDAAWSPDQKRILFAKEDDLYLADGEGGNPRRLIHCPGFPFWLRWSPDSKTIRFTVQARDGTTSLWEVSSSGENLHPVMDTGAGKRPNDCCGSWSPDGRYFVFQSESNGATALWVVPSHNGILQKSAAPIPLTTGPLSFSSPVFSRDGKKIFAIATQRRGELVRYDAGRQEFRTYLSGISADHVEFSPDRKWIAYSSYPDSVVWRSRPDGTDRLQLSPAGMIAWFPRWSPDGKRIVFNGSHPGKPLKLYLTSANGGEPETLVPGTGSETDPNWSPDGKSLMFGAVPSPTGLGPGRSDIEILNLQTHRVSRLPDSEGLGGPRWSPDGRFVVAEALARDVWAVPGVLIFDFKTGKWSEFEKDPIDNKAISNDGQYYYFDKYVDGDPAIFRIRIGDRKLERVVSLKDIRRSQGFMGWWMGLTPDGDPMVLRDTSIEEIYALDFKEP